MSSNKSSAQHAPKRSLKRGVKVFSFLIIVIENLFFFIYLSIKLNRKPTHGETSFYASTEGSSNIAQENAKFVIICLYESITKMSHVDLIHLHVVCNCMINTYFFHFMKKASKPQVLKVHSIPNRFQKPSEFQMKPPPLCL